MRFAAPESSSEETSLSAASSEYADFSPPRSPTNNPNSPVLTDNSADIMSGQGKLKWPEWSGETEDFAFFIARLSHRAQSAAESGMKTRDICLNMSESIPQDKQKMIQHWYTSGGDDGQYNWEKFIDEFSLQFENKLARLTALDEASRMRQGEAQHFSDFVADVNYKLGLAGALGGAQKWTDGARIAHMHNCLNTTLSKALIYAPLPLALLLKSWRTSKTIGRVVHRRRPGICRSRAEPLYNIKGNLQLHHLLTHRVM